ncbi:DUF2285 domain-containing protein [Achromobacter xylosoxidans]|jgi:hypothetical protein|uniref:DUF2285 domain-containing protein n=1 Tax=Alcaligenes xylosoxydans xylosoxydans TaxID=85698 RepID=UPI001F1431AE|nr:DUF2285 domain-containing protein [Achromobacter xylosoxidans]
MRTSAENAAPWQATAAYLYLLRLDVASLAWEYLRRYPAYLTAWLRDGRHGGASAARAWGLIQLEDPGLDARKAHPLWDDSLPALLHVEAAEAAAGGATGAGLLLWRLPGQKDLVALPNGAALQVRDGARLLRMRLGRGVLDGHAARCAVPLDARLHAQAALLGAHAAHLAPRRRAQTRPAGEHAAAQRVSLAARHHLHALQALDGQFAGASHRQIAEVLYGRERVRAAWHTDSALRAQLRHSLARGYALMRGGYRALAGLRPPQPGP